MSTLFKNNAVSKLASGISIGATSLTVTAGQGDKFPVVVAPDVAYVTIENASYNEIVKITARALGADTMTIVKAQEGTTDRAWLTGDTVSLRLTAAQAALGANAQDVAAAALAAHAGAVDPHPTYTTAAELAAYAQPHDAQLDTLAAITAQQATDLAALSAFIGTLLNDADAATARSTLGSLLNTRNAQAAAYGVVVGDRGKLIDATTGTWALTMNPSTLGANFAFAVRNSGTGVITLTPSTGTIDGAATATLNFGESCLVLCDGTNFNTVGKSSSTNGSFRSIQAFTTTGTSTYTAPAGVVRVKVTVVGGGGGGAAAGAANYVGGAGGAGGAAIKTIGAVAMGASVAVTVGAGGAGGVSSGNGAAGGTSSFGVFCSATGGGGGASGGFLNGGGPGSGTGGDINLTGGYGSRGTGDVCGGVGGASFIGGGGYASWGGSSGAVSAAANTGAGGGGADNTLNGGAGGSGIVIVEEFF